jgi:hypothetical protein
MMQRQMPSVVMMLPRTVLAMEDDVSSAAIRCVGKARFLPSSLQRFR